MHQSQHAIQVVSKNIVSLDLLISITFSLSANQRYQKGRGVFSSKKVKNIMNATPLQSRSSLENKLKM